MHIVFGGAIFLLVIVATAIVFVIWVVAMLAQGIWSLVTGPARSQQQRRSALDPVICNHGRCHAPNPAHARFCRRCGSPLQNQPAEMARRRQIIGAVA